MNSTRWTCPRCRLVYLASPQLAGREARHHLCPQTNPLEPLVRACQSLLERLASNDSSGAKIVRVELETALAACRRSTS